MDFSFTEDQTAVHELALKIIGDHATHDRLKALEAGEERFDRKLWEALAGADLLGVSIPEAGGGSGLGFVELCLLLEAVGRHCAAIPAWHTLVLGALPIVEFGSEEQRKRYLPAVASGKMILTAALVDTESDDPRTPAVSARHNGSTWRLDGVKMCVPMAHVADTVLVTARTGDNRTGIFLVDPKAAGLTLERQETTQGEPQFRIDLTGVSVTGDDVLGDPAGGETMLDWLLQRAVAALCVIEVGVAERALRMTASYTSTREQFGKPIAKFQAVAQRAADAYIDVEAMRWTAWQAAWRIAEGLPAAEATAIAKFWVGEAGHRVVYAAQHLHGGLGVDLDYPLFRSYLWSKQIETTLGTATEHLAWLGRRIAAESVG